MSLGPDNFSIQDEIKKLDEQFEIDSLAYGFWGADSDLLKQQKTSIWDMITSIPPNPFDIPHYFLREATPFEKLYKSVEERNVEAVKAFIVNPYPLRDENPTKKEWITLLMLAASKKQTEIINVLKKKINVWETMLILEGAKFCPNALRVLLDLGYDINVGDSQGNTPLHAAVANNEYKAVYNLLKLGADVNAVNHNGQNPLNMGIRWQGRESIQMLCTLYPDLNFIEAKDNDGNTALMRAKCHNSKASKALIELGSDVNAKDSTGYTPLLQSIKCKCRPSSDMTKMLIESGADFYAVNDLEGGKTLLQYAAEWGKLNSVRQLIRQQELKNNGLYRYAHQFLQNDAVKDLAIKNKKDADFKQGLDIVFSPYMLSVIRLKIMNYCTGPLTYDELQDKKAETIYKEVYAPRIEKDLVNFYANNNPVKVKVL